tara:strand:+ start:5732 stop:6046 length:315 start_codon:yes stop_codon:yes gene_type:complete
MSELTVSTTVDENQLPSLKTLEHASKIAILEDKPILLDYWTDSFNGKALIGVKQTEEQEKILIKSEEEYTSPIKQIFKTSDEYLVITENSIYVVSTKIPMKKIS